MRDMPPTALYLWSPSPAEHTRAVDAGMIEFSWFDYQQRIQAVAEEARAMGVAVILVPASVAGILGALDVLGLPNTPDGRALAIMSIGSEGQPVAFDGELRRLGGAQGQGVWAWRSGEIEPRAFDLLARDTFSFESADGLVLVPAAEPEEKLAWVKRYPAHDGHYWVPRAEWDAWAGATIEGLGWAPEDELAILDRAAREW